MGDVMTSKAAQIVWDDALSVGHKKLDGQHKGLIRLINDFGCSDLTEEKMAGKLDGLIAYAARHFHDEEDFIMRKAPGILSKQMESHAGFIEKAYEFTHRFNLEEEAAALRQDVYDFLCDWLMKHIKEEDQEYNPNSPK